MKSGEKTVVQAKEEGLTLADLTDEERALFPGIGGELQKTLLSLINTRRRAAAREAEEKPKQAATPKTADVVWLPFWGDDKRGTPNCFLRSALFAAIYGNAERKYLKNALLAVQGDNSISFTGEQLSQSDLDLVMAALHLARKHPLGHVCHFKGYAFLKMVGRSDNKDNYVWMDATITRLIACEVKIRLGKRLFKGSILSSCTADEGNDVYKLTFDPDFVKLFGFGDWTAVDWETRKKISRSPLAQWIYDYAVSHVGSSIKLETLQRLSGREDESLKLFMKAIRRAKELLETRAETILTVDNDLVVISHKLSPAQARHVAHKTTPNGRKK